MLLSGGGVAVMLHPHFCVIGREKSCFKRNEC
nr:MAG TPA: hypothetical protein [Caudoviricetes sp.]